MTDYIDYTNKKLSEEELRKVLSETMVVKEVDLDDTQLLMKNANIMDEKKMNRLIENIKRDGRLTSFPFMHKLPNGKYEVISGNHRVRASRIAGLTKITAICCEVTLPKDEKLRLQISHNAIHGEQSNIMLVDLITEFGSTELVRLSGADFDIDKLKNEKIELKSIDSSGLEFREITLYFTKYELDVISETLNDVGTKLENDKNEVYLLEQSRYKKFVDCITETKKQANIKSTATILNLFIDYLAVNKEAFIDSLKAPNNEKIS